MQTMCGPPVARDVQPKAVIIWSHGDDNVLSEPRDVAGAQREHAPAARAQPSADAPAGPSWRPTGHAAPDAAPGPAAAKPADLADRKLQAALSLSGCRRRYTCESASPDWTTSRSSSTPAPGSSVFNSYASTSLPAIVCTASECSRVHATGTHER
jgi:hypothetical protein